MRLFRPIAAVLMVLMGTVWTLQGFDVLGGSQMSGSGFWGWAGIATLIGGLALAASILRHRRGAGGG